MDIVLKEITVEELTKGFVDNEENGVISFDGKLDIRPPYQREFIYKDKQRSAVIDTVFKGFPLNVMYWAKRDDGTFEVIDGQQRTLSICQYVNGDFAFDFRYFHNLQADEKKSFLNYRLMVYICTGADSEKLQWFKTINIAGEKLTNQELLNAVYSGSWVTDAKRYFSKSGCAAYSIGRDYLKGTPIRQEYLETAIDWISNGNVEVYMSNHQHDNKAIHLWNYYQNVIAWIDSTFPVKRPKFMRGVNWGKLYNDFKTVDLNSYTLESQISQLIADDDVENKRGIYSYILTKKEKFLSLRSFSDSMKQKVFEKQNGICLECDEHFSVAEMEGDHITPWHLGGKTIEENCQMLCRACNREKSGK
jgi:hypothetical protein